MMCFGETIWHPKMRRMIIATRWLTWMHQKKWEAASTRRNGELGIRAMKWCIERLRKISLPQNKKWWSAHIMCTLPSNRKSRRYKEEFSTHRYNERAWPHDIYNLAVEKKQDPFDFNSDVIAMNASMRVEGRRCGANQIPRGKRSKIVSR